ncbi:MAG: helix-turn-helix transcriptional regulator [Cetobacterium sp.]|uniref:sigma factor-like helix-turn-helix DNA-binding protein n=1 Tax=Cetobacterium sp. ZWU0022 TaxID=1340502 RepID=UPI0006457E19|nr:sigma factor-like helix-turn-helix DNA-binding protein [Cetobacterium sp. ZWU0022]
MKVYNSENIDIYTDDDSVFAHRDTSEAHKERIRIKNAVMETLMKSSGIAFGKREKEYWELYKTGMSNKDISQILGVSESACRSLKLRASKKISTLARELREKIE